MPIFLQISEATAAGWGSHVVCDTFPVAHSVIAQLFYVAVFFSLIVASCTGNLMVVWIVLRHERMRTVTNYYLLNLAVSDLAITILNTGFSGTYNLYYNWIFSSAHCAFNNLMVCKKGGRSCARIKPFGRRVKT